MTVRFRYISRIHSLTGIIVDDHFLAVLRKSLKTFQDTDGLFDVTIQPLVQAWGFGARPITELPDSQAIRALAECVGSQNLQVNGNKIVKKKSCTRIDLN